MTIKFIKDREEQKKHLLDEVHYWMTRQIEVQGAIEIHQKVLDFYKMVGRDNLIEGRQNDLEADQQYLFEIKARIQNLADDFTSLVSPEYAEAKARVQEREMQEAAKAEEWY
jgi:hypothetical protein